MYIDNDGRRYIEGEDLAPGCDDLIFSTTKFYVEPLGLTEHPVVQKMIKLYHQCEKGCILFTSEGPYTQAAQDAVFLLSQTMETCRASWQQRFLQKKGMR